MAQDIKQFLIAVGEAHLSFGDTGATTDRVLADPLLRSHCSAEMAQTHTIGKRIGCPIEQSRLACLFGRVHGLYPQSE